jgi:hypothetical protein
MKYSLDLYLPVVDLEYREIPGFRRKLISSEGRRLLDGCRKQGTNRVLYQGKGGMSSPKNLMGEMTVGVERLEVSMHKVLMSLHSALSPAYIRTLVMTTPVRIFKNFDIRDRMIPHILELEVFCGVGGSLLY